MRSYHATSGEASRVWSCGSTTSRSHSSAKCWSACVRARSTSGRSRCCAAPIRSRSSPTSSWEPTAPARSSRDPQEELRGKIQQHDEQGESHTNTATPLTHLSHPPRL